MLADKNAFAVMEQILTSNNTIERFEKENGPIKGRMMINVIDIPEKIVYEKDSSGAPFAFEASFDFYDCTIGLVLCPVSRKILSGLWVTPQKGNAEQPSKDWIEFFVQTLLSNIREDGSFGVPIYSFVNDTCDMTFAPTSPKP